MSRNDNYPDDIRQYDDNPQSPFYVEPLTDEELEAKYEAEISAYEGDHEI